MNIRAWVLSRLAEWVRRKEVELAKQAVGGMVEIDSEGRVAGDPWARSVAARPAARTMARMMTPPTPPSGEERKKGPGPQWVRDPGGAYHCAQFSFFVRGDELVLDCDALGEISMPLDLVREAVAARGAE